MRYLLLILSLFTASIVHAQTDSIKFSTYEVKQIDRMIDSLEFEVQKQIELNKQIQLQSLEYEYQLKLDSLEIGMIQAQNLILRDNIDLYIQREKSLQPKWYDNKTIWFVGGIITTVATGKLIVYGVYK